MNDKPLTILLIEDNPGDVRLIEEILKESKVLRFNFEHADCLLKGLECLKKGIDILLLDLNLPDSYGLDTVIKAHTLMPKVPIVIITTLADEELALNALRKGAQDYLVKDKIEIELLTRSISYAIERNRLLGELEKAREIEQRLKEIGFLEKFSKIAQTPVAERIFSMKPLIKTAPVKFGKIISRYGDLMDLALELLTHKVEYNVSEKLSVMAEELGFLNAGPRDVVQVHSTVLRRKTSSVSSEKVQAYLEEGRVMLLELMGYLILFYRKYYLRFLGAAESGNKRNVNTTSPSIGEKNE